MEDPELRTISTKQFLMLDGQGAPDDVVAYTAVMRRALAAMGSQPGLLEALWWSDPADSDDPTTWRWTLMIQPSGEPTTDTLARAVAKARAEKDDPQLAKLRLETYAEGQVVQVLFTGNLADKQPRLEAMLAYALEQGLVPEGKYHEIYIDEPGPDAPIAPKTILRQPVKPKPA